jgi:outer membrane protein OmpA-like peptidoglycan-associated protein
LSAPFPKPTGSVITHFRHDNCALVIIGGARGRFRFRMKFRHWFTIGLLAGTVGLSACGDRPGRDDEVLFADPYPDLASVPADKPRSRAVSRHTKNLYDGFQAVPNEGALVAADFNPVLAQPVAPPRSIMEVRGAEEFTSLMLDNSTATALLVRQQETDVFFGIEEQIAQDAISRAREERERIEREEAMAKAREEFEARRAEQMQLMQERAELQALLEMTPEVEVTSGPTKQPGSLADLFFDITVGDPVSIVYFDPESAELGEREMQILRPIAAVALQNNQNLILHGHTNGYRFTRTQAHRDLHMKMSKQRAESTKAALVEMGVPAGRIQIEWFGDLRPVWAEVNGMTSQGNRRVEIFIKIPERLVTRGSSLLGQ